MSHINTTREVANYHFGYPTYIARVSKKYPFDNYRFMDTGGSIYEEAPARSVASIGPPKVTIHASPTCPVCAAPAAGTAGSVMLTSCSRTGKRWADERPWTGSPRQASTGG
jgi:hydrogenase maturation factor